MSFMHSADAYRDLVPVPRIAVSFPIELPIPDGFDPERPETWPDVEGSLEFVAGKLLYMPPCGNRQQVTVMDISAVLGAWRKSHREYVVGGNEAGMRLDKDTRGADAAVWRKKDVGPLTDGFPRVPPILAVEVAGRYDDEASLRNKALWYFDHGVIVVWLLFPRGREVLVLTSDTERRFAIGDRLAPHPELPGLEPEVAELFEQVSEIRRDP